MAFCPNCGAEVDGKFCPKCGTAISGASEGGGAGPGQPSAPGPPPSQAQPVPQVQPGASAGMEDNVAGTLCYVLGFITGIIFLVIEPYNRNKTIRFHAFQSIFLSVGLIIISIALSVILPWSASLVISPLFSLACFVLWIFILIKTYQKQKVVLPIIGPMAEKQA